MSQDFPGGPVVKNLPANAGDTGSISGLGRFHMLWASYAHEPQLVKPDHSRACAPQQEKPPQWEAHERQLESSPPYHNQRKFCSAAKTQHSQK